MNLEERGAVTAAAIGRRTCALVACVLLLGTAAPAQAQPITGLTTTNGIFKFDSATPGTLGFVTPVTGLDAGDSLIAIDRNPADGILYGLGRQPATSVTRMYRISEAGAATTVGPVFGTSLTSAAADVDFEPDSFGRARIITGSDQNIVWFAFDGSTAVKTNLGYPAGDPRDAINPTGVGLAHSNNYPGAPSSTAYVYDFSSPDALANLGTAGGQSSSGDGGLLTTVNDVGVIASSGGNVGLDAAPDGTLFALLRVGTTGLYTINPATGAASLVGTMGGGSDTVRDIATSAAVNDFSFAASSFAATESTGKLGVTITRSQSHGSASVRLTTSDGSATSAAFTDYKAFNALIPFADGQTSKTIDVELRSDTTDEPAETLTLTLSEASGGDAGLAAPSTAVGQIDDDDSGPAPGTTLTALTKANALVTFDTRSPGTLSAPLPITGLTGGELLAGIDRRPATGRLYALSDQSRLYLIDEGTGAATQIGSGQFSPPLTGLGWGFDFSPTADRVRIGSRGTAQNLRLNPDTGAVFVDAQLLYAAGDQFAGQMVGAAGLAYTNNVPGATSTTLFGYDYTKDVLFQLGSPGGSPISPNTGTAFSIGKRTVTAQNALSVGIDIAPDGIAWALLRDSDITRLNMYPDLTTGIPALVGTIGDGSDTISDIAAPPVSNTIQFGASAYGAAESAGSAAVTVIRGQALGTASVDYATAAGSAADGADYTAASGTLTFAAGETSKAISIPLTNDGVPEAAEAFTVTLSNPAGGVASLGAPTTATVTVSDDDLAPDTIKPVVTLCGKAKQRIVKRKRVKACFISSENGDGDAAARLKIAGSKRTFRLARVTRPVTKDVKRTIALRLSGKALEAARAALRRGRKVTVVVKIRVRDAAKNETSAKRTIKARR